MLSFVVPSSLFQHLPAINMHWYLLFALLQ